MRCLRWMILALGLFAVCLGQAARGGEYTDPGGFSFTYPDDWVAVNRAMLADAQKQIAPGVKEWLDKNKMDLGRVHVVVLRQGHDENLNVIINEKELPVTDQAVQELRKVLPQQFQAAGVKVDRFQVEIQKIGPHEAIVSEFEAWLAISPTPVKEKQVYLPGGGKTYIITCTAPADSFPQQAATFDQILASFKVPPPTPRGFEWNWLTSAIVGMAGGAIIGGGIGLYKKLTVRQKA